MCKGGITDSLYAPCNYRLTQATICLHVLHHCFCFFYCIVFLDQDFNISAGGIWFLIWQCHVIKCHSIKQWYILSNDEIQKRQCQYGCSRFISLDVSFLHLVVQRLEQCSLTSLWAVYKFNPPTIMQKYTLCMITLFTHRTELPASHGASKVHMCSELRSHG